MAEGDIGSRYGPWALVVGASEGVGAELARLVAGRGGHVALVARRQEVLDELASSIRQTSGVETRTIAVDLVEPDAADRLAEATSGLEVGLLAYCAGADPQYRGFLEQPAAAAVTMVQRNCVVPLQLCHRFAPPMVDRGRGALVLLGSGAGLVGGPNMVAYGASKAFDMVMGEALWAELHGRGVDVLGVILGATDTPALRRLLAQRGVLAEGDEATPIPGATSAGTVAAEILANLANGPTWFVGDELRDGAQQLGALPRNQAVRIMMEAGRGLMGPDPD